MGNKVRERELGGKGKLPSKGGISGQGPLGGLPSAAGAFEG